MNLHYYNSNVAPLVGDYIATGKMGQSDVLSITLDGELEVKNRMTGEVFCVFADDCDLIERPASAPVSVPSVAAPALVLVLRGEELVNVEFGRDAAAVARLAGRLEAGSSLRTVVMPLGLALRAEAMEDALKAILENGNVDCGTYWKVDVDDIEQVRRALA